MNAQNDAISTDLVEYGKKSPALIEKIAEVADAAHRSGVALDIPAEQVASMALELKLSDTQLDVLMLARQDDDAEFAVMETLLRAGFSPDQIHAAHYLVNDFLSHSSSTDASRDDREIVVSRVAALPSAELREEALSLEDLLDRADEQESSAKPSREGANRMIESRRNKYVAMFCIMFEEIKDLGHEIYDLESLRSMLVTLIERAQKRRLVSSDYSELQAIARIYAYAKSNHLESYDEIMRSIEGQQ